MFETKLDKAYIAYRRDILPMIRTSRRGKILAVIYVITMRVAIVAMSLVIGWEVFFGCLLERELDMVNLTVANTLGVLVTVVMAKVLSYIVFGKGAKNNGY